MGHVLPSSLACVEGQCSSGAASSTTTTSKTYLLPTSITVQCSPTTAVYGIPSLCTANVTTLSGALAGTVSFSTNDRRGVFSQLNCWTYSNNNNLLINQPHSRSLECVVDYTARSYVRQVITAVYSGDATHASVQGSYSFNVARPSSNGLGQQQQQLQRQQPVVASPDVTPEVAAASPAASPQGANVWMISAPLPVLAFEVSIVVGTVLALAADNNMPGSSRKKKKKTQQSTKKGNTSGRNRRFQWLRSR